MASSPKLIDQSRHHKTWEELARNSVYHAMDRGVLNLLADEDFFWRKVEQNCKSDCGRDLFKARAKIGNLINLEKARGRLDHWAYSANKLTALAELAEAVAHKIQEAKYGRSYL